MQRNNTEFTILKAYNGDCILIKTFTSTFDEFVILIDGGTATTFDFSLKRELEKIEKIDLLILTHIDSDHIGGLIKMFGNSIINRILIDEIWINHPEFINVNSNELISFGQANNLKNLILEKKPNIRIRSISTNDKDIHIDSLIFTILSPTEEILNLLSSKWEYSINTSNNQNEDISLTIEDDSYNTNLKELSLKEFNPNSTVENDIINASSISFLLTCPDKSILLLADSRPEIIESELEELGFIKTNKINCDYLKISHHASKNNTSGTLLERINCLNYIISTNGGSSRNKHPSRETIARIIYNEERNFNNKISIFTNYPISDIKSKIGEFIKEEEDLNNGNWVIENENKF
jgi:beta-lactamase superfamily II metal-dependent hydrolase